MFFEKYIYQIQPTSNSSQPFEKDKLPQSSFDRNKEDVNSENGAMYYR